MQRAPIAPRLGATAGAALLDALLALLVVALLSASLLSQQDTLRRARSAARERIDAMQLARREIDRLRDPAASSEAASAPPPFTVSHRDVPDPQYPLALRDRSVDVTWQGPTPDVHRVQLAARTPVGAPVLDAVLSLAPQDIAIARPQGRSPDIPFDAVSIAPGHSRWQPGGPGSTAWVFEDAGGAIVSRCDAASPACDPATGSALSGHVRFSATVPADPGTAGDPLLPLAVQLVLDGRPQRQFDCAVQPVSNPAMRYMRYGCVIPDPPAAGWSGRVDIAPLGWGIGTGAGSWRVCRYSTDLDGSGAIDRNDEHPARYTAVRGTLAQQNFLVIRGDQPCPAGASHNDALLDTVQHQP